MASRAEVLAKIIDVVTQVTLADKSNVGESSHLFQDLGVESIDFIDIIYNLETTFGVEVSSDALFTDRDFFESDAGNWDGNQFTAKGQAALADFPYLNKTRLAREPQDYLYSVGMLVDFIESRLKAS